MSRRSSSAARTTQISFKDKGIAPADLAGKQVGSWGFGNEWELFAGMQKDGVAAQRHLARAAALRHERLPRRRHRRRAGDDLQRVRPGPRDGQPRHRRALQARRPQRHQLERGRHGDAAGRDLGRRRQARPTTTTPSRPSPSSRRPSRAGSTRDNPEEAANIVTAAGSTLGTEPPALDDQRGQQADLALDRRRRHDRRGRVGPDGEIAKTRRTRPARPSSARTRRRPPTRTSTSRRRSPSLRTRASTPAAPTTSRSR